MRHLTGLADLSCDEFGKLLERAIELKADGIQPTLEGKQVVHIFDKASLRTRASMDVATCRLGARSSFFSIKDDFWPVDFGGIAQAATAPSGTEDIREFASVLSLYYDCICARITDDYSDVNKYLLDHNFRTFVQNSRKSVVNLNSSMEHPLQGLADAMTMKELSPQISGEIVVTWVPNTKPRGWASAQSALIGAAHLGRNVILCHPEGYVLSEEHMRTVSRLCADHGTTFEIRHTQDEALERASIVYAKSWIAPGNFGNMEGVLADSHKYRDWHLTLDRLADDGSVLHPLPATRNVELLDEIMNRYQAVLLQQAGNKVYSNAAALEFAFGRI